MQKRIAFYSFIIAAFLALLSGFVLPSYASGIGDELTTEDGLSHNSSDNDGSTEELTEAPIHQIYYCLENEVTTTTSIFAEVRYAGSVPVITEARAGSNIVIYALEPSWEDSVERFVRFQLYKYDASTDTHTFLDGSDIYEVYSRTFQMVMPDSDLLIQIITEEDPGKVEESESASVAESESVSEQESIEESIANERAAYQYGAYKIIYDLSEVGSPYPGFVFAKDNTSFPKTVQGFYSTKYRIFVYYAEYLNTKDYYVKNVMEDSLIPFTVIENSRGIRYIVSAPGGINEVPGIYKAQIYQNVENYEGLSRRVPCYIVEDQGGEELKLLCLLTDDGRRDYYVYEVLSDRVRLVSYTDYEKAKGYSVEDTTESERSFSPETPGENEGFLKNYIVWILIGGIILAIIIAALVLVFIMTKKQENAEALIDEDDHSEDDDFNEFNDFVEEVEPEVPFDISSYSNPTSDDRKAEGESFDVSFENAFPDEVSIVVKKESRESGDGSSEKEGTINRVFDFTFDFQGDPSASDPEETSKIDQTESEKKASSEKLCDADFEEIIYRKNEDKASSEGINDL